MIDPAHQRLRIDYAKSTIERLGQVPNSADAIRVLAGFGILRGLLFKHAVVDSRLLAGLHYGDQENRPTLKSTL